MRNEGKHSVYQVPDWWPDAMQRYLEHGIPMGGFGMSVLENDLRGAVGRADEYSKQCLTDLVRYCMWEIPGSAWGSPEKCDAWMEARAVERNAIPKVEDTVLTTREIIQMLDETNQGSTHGTASIPATDRTSVDCVVSPVADGDVQP